MNSPAPKPEFCVVDGHLWVFVGADYKRLDRAKAKKFVKDAQRNYALLLREEKRKKRVG